MMRSSINDNHTPEGKLKGTAIMPYAVCMSDDDDDDDKLKQILNLTI